MNYRKPSLIYMGPDMVGRGLAGAWYGGCNMVWNVPTLGEISRAINHISPDLRPCAHRISQFCLMLFTAILEPKQGKKYSRLLNCIIYCNCCTWGVGGSLRGISRAAKHNSVVKIKTKKGKTINVCFIQSCNKFAWKIVNFWKYETCWCYGWLLKLPQLKFDTL